MKSVIMPVYVMMVFAHGIGLEPPAMSHYTHAAPSVGESNLIAERTHAAYPVSSRQRDITKPS